MTKLLVATALLASLSPFASAAHASSLVVNGDFQATNGVNPPTNWNITGLTHLATGAYNHTAGTGSQYGLGLDNGGVTASLYQDITGLTIGEIYKLDFFFSTETDTQPNWISPLFGGATVATISNGPNSFTEYSYNVTANDTTQRLQFNWNTGGGNYLAIDDISLTDTGTANPLGGTGAPAAPLPPAVLSALPLLALLPFARKRLRNA